MDKSPAKRRVPNFRLHTDKPDRIVAAAFPVLCAVSHDKVRMAEIAGALGLSKSAVLHHFPTKLALFKAVITHYCLPQGAGVDLATELSAGDANKVLAMVVREAPGLPEIGPFYRDCLVETLAQMQATAERQALYQKVDAVLRVALFAHLFAADGEARSGGVA